MENPTPWSLQGGKMVCTFLDANGEDIFGKSFWTEPGMKDSGSYIALESAELIIKAVNSYKIPR